MRGIQVFICAAGSQDRWNEFPCTYKIKQLIPIHGKPLIQRTIEQVKLMTGISPVVLCHNADIQDACRDSLYIKEPFIVSTVLSSLKYCMEKRIIFLLGDVYYSHEALSKIFKCEKYFALLGSDYRGEIYALSFVTGIKKRLKQKLEQCILEAQSDVVAYNKGKLWSLYRFWTGKPYIDMNYDGNVFIDVHDEQTTDFDIPQQYYDYLKKHKCQELESY